LHGSALKATYLPSDAGNGGSKREDASPYSLSRAVAGNDRVIVPSATLPAAFTRSFIESYFPVAKVQSGKARINCEIKN